MSRDFRGINAYLKGGRELAKRPYTKQEYYQTGAGEKNISPIEK